MLLDILLLNLLLLLLRSAATAGWWVRKFCFLTLCTVATACGNLSSPWGILSGVIGQCSLWRRHSWPAPPASLESQPQCRLRGSLVPASRLAWRQLSLVLLPKTERIPRHGGGGGDRCDRPLDAPPQEPRAGSTPHAQGHQYCQACRVIVC